MSIVLAKDAFLVFRALCKLSIRSSESSTGTDPTAVRGKVRFLTTSLSKYMSSPIWYLGCMQQLPPCTSPLILPLLSSSTCHDGPQSLTFQCMMLFAFNKSAACMCPEIGKSSALCCGLQNMW